MFVVGNATQTAHYYQSAFGMELVAYSGPETGNRDHKAFVLRVRLGPVRRQGRRRPGQPAAPTTTAGTATASSTSRSRCPTSTAASRTRDAQGATVLEEPHDLTDEHGTVRIAAIADLRRDPAHPGRPLALRRLYLPGYVAARRAERARRRSAERLFQALDHFVGNVELGQMDEWVEFYNRVMGFTNMAEFIGDDIATDYSALMSKVVANGNHRVKFPLNEPAIAASGSARSTSTSSSTAAPACQHIALATNDILRTVDALRADGVEFLDTPDTYYDDPELRARIGEVRVPIEELKERKILVDRDEDGYLLQIFTKPVGDRPTVFFELIERHGSLGFGKGNFKALFESIEREQELRGNL